jgi:YidC/Oxa1 family membrane protein insertase
MSFIKSLFSTLIFQPLYNLLIVLYVIIPDLGVAIIILTIIIRILLIPLSRKSIESQKKMQEIQPELKKIQEKYKHDKQLQGKKVMEFYKEKKINPAGGCLPMIIQLIFLITLYRVFMLGLNTPEVSDLVYSFIKNPGQLNPIAFGFLDLAKPSIFLAVITALAQYWQGKMMLARKEEDKKLMPAKKKEKKEDDAPDFGAMMQQQMVYMGPILTLVIGMKFASGLILYWLVTTVFMAIQQWFIIQKDKKILKSKTTGQAN